MDAPDTLTALQLASSMLILGYASVLDWRTRRVGNLYWILLSIMAIVLLCARVLADDEPVEYLLILVPVLAVLADIYGPFGESDGAARFVPLLLYGVAIGSTVYLAHMWIDNIYFAHLLTIPVMMIAIVVMYMLDIIRGGADAKALVAISVMFPFYPDIGSFPMIEAINAFAEVVFPFSFVVLVNAAIIVAFTPIAFAAKNLAAGEFEFPFGFLGYRLDAETAKSSKVWLMERMEDGAHRRFTRPQRDEELEEEVDKLMTAGHKRIWVTPKVPFIIPITLSLVFTTVVGNILLVLMGL